MFERHELVKDEEGYILILYIQSQPTEFADEIGNINKRNTRLLRAKVKRYIREKLPEDINVVKAKIMMGSLLVGTVDP